MFSICSVLAIIFFLFFPPLISLGCTPCSELKLFGKIKLEISYLQTIREPLCFCQLHNAEGKSVS